MIFNIPLIGLWIRVLAVPHHMLYPPKRGTTATAPTVAGGNPHSAIVKSVEKAA